GVRAGEPVDTVARDLPGILDVKNRAEMIAHTEIARAVSAASMDRYSAAGVTRTEWLTAPDDGRVCVACQANRDAGPVPTGDLFPSGVPSPPAHPRCRCAAAPAALGTVTLAAVPVLVKDAADLTDPNPVEAAGLAVQANGTGRVLMLQRALGENGDDSNGGMWEFPGGKLDPGETSIEAARREWAEETGRTVPDGDIVGGWTSPDGIYQGFVYAVPDEDAVPVDGGRGQVTNPDDPDGDQVEAIAWWDPALLRDNPAVRPELAGDLDTVLAALGAASVKRVKVSKNSVRYRAATDPDRSCGTCSMYEDHACSLVAGVIDPADVCDRWEPAPVAKAGNAETLREYWTHEAHGGPTHFAGAEKIRWGQPGDFDRCVTLVGEYMDADKVKGYCANMHHRALGYWPATHAAMERGKTAVPSLLKDAADLADPNEVEPEHVANLMRKNYPEKAIQWVYDARWIGPVLIPQDRIDCDDEKTWAASHQPEAVARFAKDIKNGTGHTHPVIMVQTPDDDKVDIVDGHHRTLAYRKLGKPVKSYVGFVPKGDDRWQETHSSQIHQGGDVANR
ncbi:MAG TPA: NUDIX domain-containing protein, partial [Mycobacterium sp.]